ncbi:hypothetical protein RB601_002709 [Gaeumannomyces tritici]
MELIPWDPDSPEHCDRMYRQRIACGWAWEIEKFKETSIKGSVVYYWIALKDDFPGKEDIIAKHTSKFPEESAPLQDTATSTWAEPRAAAPAVPTHAFMPLGHVGLGRLQPDDERAMLAAGGSGSGSGNGSATMAWVGPLYVSWAIQRIGLGRFAMDEAERLARLPPVGAGVVGLDAVRGDQALQPDLVRTHYEERGFPTPVITNHDWYLTRGYSEYWRKDNAYPWTDSKTGELRQLGCVYLKKELPRP